MSTLINNVPFPASEAQPGVGAPEQGHTPKAPSLLSLFGAGGTSAATCPEVLRLSLQVLQLRNRVL